MFPDFDFESLVETADIGYIPNEDFYSYQTGSVQTGQEYLVRIINEKYYTTLLGDIITTRTVSEIARFNTLDDFSDFSY